MNNLKKVGLTALAASLVATSAISAEWGLSGSAGMKIENNSQSATGKAFSMPNSIYITGSGETDGGLTISASYEMDQGTGNNSSLGFDNHSVSVGSDAMGTLTLHGHGGSSAQSALDTTAAGDLWDNGFGISTAHDPSSSLTSDNMLYYTLPSFVDGVSIAASYTPDGSGHESSTAYSLTYTGVEGLSLSWGYGDDNSSVGVDADATTVKASYAIGSFTVGLSNTDYSTTTASSDQDVTSWNLAYTVSDAISIAYGSETHELEGSATDIEISGMSASYTAGGMTISAAAIDADNVGHSTAATADREYWLLGASFAF